MKLIIILLLVCNFCTLNAQVDLEIPPGTIKLNDSLYIDKAPVTNLMFLEYLTIKHALENKGYSSFSKFAKDTNEKGFPKNLTTIIEPAPVLIEFYSNNKYLERTGYGWKNRYRYHPVLNISKNQAIDYCQWRSEMVSHLWSNHDDYSSVKNLSDKISYRLATNNELILATSFFSNLNLIVESREELLKMKQEKEITAFTILSINEMTLSDQLFNEQLNFEFTGFRCVCEMTD
jgi:hypothetical protein